MSPQGPQVRLVIFDPKTQAVLRVLTEPIRPTAFPASERKNFKLTLAKAVNDMRELAAAARP